MMENDKNHEIDEEDFQFDEIFVDDSVLFTLHNSNKEKETESHTNRTRNNSLNISALCCDEELSGFDKLSGETWIYPTNYPVRDYQYNIIQAAIYKNTLVSLPTGLGKTFIAAVIMYNFYRWYPMGKIIFTAPTRPLVAQQIDACYNIMAIPPSDTIEMTGGMQVKNRTLSWKTKRVFFATPQVIFNDLKSGVCPANLIRCLVFDEAHRARGKYAYCQIIESLKEQKHFTYRVLALSATPGSKVEDVINVVKSLQICHLELRTEGCLDVAPYSHSRKINTVVIPFGEELSSLRNKFIEIVDVYTRRLKQINILSGCTGNLTKGRILMLFKEYQNKERSQRHPNHNQIMKDFLPLISLYHGLELLTKHGARVFLNYFDEHTEKSWTARDNQLTAFLERLRDDLGLNPLSLDRSTLPDGSFIEIPKDLKFGHPKFEYLRSIMVKHFKDFEKNGQETKAIVFCEYRESVNLVHCLLLQCRPLIKPQMFVGQGAGNASGRKDQNTKAVVSQKQQLRIMRAFRSGECNTLVSTCVAEEGLDVGSVDLILCFDISTRSPVRLVQRCGRTGRERGGQVYMLVTEGKEHQTLKDCMQQRDNLNKRVMQSKELLKNLYKSNPRMLPVNMNPKCHKMFITVQKKQEKIETSKKGQADLRIMLGGDRLRTSNSSPGPCTSNHLISREDYEKLYPDGFKLSKTFPDTQFVWNFSKDNIIKSAKEDKTSDKINISEWLAWQRNLQSSVNLGHSNNTKILSNLLQYADAKRFELPTSSQIPAYPTQMLNTQQLAPSELVFKKRTGLKKKPINTKSPTKRDGDIRAIFSTAMKSTKEFTKIINEIGIDSKRSHLPTNLINLLVDLSVDKNKYDTELQCIQCDAMKNIFLEKTNTSKLNEFQSIILKGDIEIPTISILDQITQTSFNKSIPLYHKNISLSQDLFMDTTLETPLHIENRSLKVLSAFEENIYKNDDFDVGNIDDIFADSITNNSKLSDGDYGLDDLNIHTKANMNIYTKHHNGDRKLSPLREKVGADISKSNYLNGEVDKEMEYKDNSSNSNKTVDALNFFGLHSIDDIFADDTINKEFNETKNVSPNDQIINGSPTIGLKDFLNPKPFRSCSPILGSQPRKLTLSTKKKLNNCHKSSTPKINNTNSNGLKPLLLVDRIKSFNESLKQEDNNYNYSVKELDNSTKKVFPGEHENYTRNIENLGDSSKSKSTSLYSITQIVNIINQQQQNNKSSKNHKKVPFTKTTNNNSNNEQPNNVIISEHEYGDQVDEIMHSPILCSQRPLVKSPILCSQKKNKISNHSFSINESLIILESSSDSDDMQNCCIKDLEDNQHMNMKRKDTTTKSVHNNEFNLNKRKRDIDTIECSPYFNKIPKLDLFKIENVNREKPKLSLREKLSSAIELSKTEDNKLVVKNNKHDILYCHSIETNFELKENTHPIIQDSAGMNEKITNKNGLVKLFKNDTMTQKLQNIINLQKYKKCSSIHRGENLDQQNFTEGVNKNVYSNISPDNSSEDFDISIKSKISQNLHKKYERINSGKRSKVRKKSKRKYCDFIEYEADMSDDSNILSGDEILSSIDGSDVEGSILDFICDEEDKLEEDAVDMQALYLKSVKSPIKGVFKIPSKPKFNMNVFSQNEVYNDTNYEHDSFCVDSNIGMTQNHELSELEIAERKLRQNRKAKRRKPSKLDIKLINDSSPELSTNIRRNPRRLDSDSSDDNN